MFTGIVESVGTVLECTAGIHTRRVVVETTLPVERLPLGASIAVDGVCLTVVERAAGQFAADLGPETLARTTLANLQMGQRVHLERPLAAGDPLGGHLVSGHVDDMGRIVSVNRRGDACELRIAVPKELARYLVPKGSVAVDGVSLTINTVDSVGPVDGFDGVRFGVTLIPHTIAMTNLGRRSVGDAVNLEVDPIAKHVEHLVRLYVGSATPREG
jgi:riboflavin synthase